LAESLSPRLSSQALDIGRDLVLGIFQAWRRDLNGIDALLLLAITRSNVDGVLYSRELRARFGGPNPIAPSDLRQPVGPDIVAYSLGFEPTATRRRLRRLAERNECVFTPSGLLITEDQIEATSRLHIVLLVYELLRTSYAELRTLGFFEYVPLPPFDLAEQHGSAIRPAAAHAAKYVLRLLTTIGRRAGDALDGLIWLHLRQQHEHEPSLLSVAAALGLPRKTLVRRVDRLISEALCERRPRALMASAPESGWLAYVAKSNVSHLFQLFSGLAEVGALAEFERDIAGRPDADFGNDSEGD